MIKLKYTSHKKTKGRLVGLYNLPAGSQRTAKKVSSWLFLFFGPREIPVFNAMYF